jgi:hypothetical protein
MDERPLLFDDNMIAELRETLNPARERYAFKFTMDRWAELILEDDLHPANAEPAVEPIENMAELVAHILDAPREAVHLKEDEPVRRRGRRRVDLERYAALLLAVIFYEYTKAKPTRVTRSDAMPTDRANTFARDKTSPFYRFAMACLEAVGLTASEDALREATERWNDPIKKRALRQLLWGRLPCPEDQGPNLAWQEKRLRRRKISPVRNSAARQKAHKIKPL